MDEPRDLSQPPKRQPTPIDETTPETLPEAQELILRLRRELVDLEALAARHAELYEARVAALRAELEATRLPL